MPVRLVLSLFVAIALVSCGGGGDRKDVEDLLDRAFSTTIESADLEFDATLKLEGTGSDRPVKIRASGPFRLNDGKLPSVDLELRIGNDGGQTIQTGFLSTGDRAFVRFEDVYYEQPASQVRKANASIRRTRGSKTSLRSLGIDPRSWLSKAEDEGEEKVAGVQTRHVSGELDVEAVMRNVNEFVKRSRAAIGGATGQDPPDPLSAEDIREIADVVDDPTFDVYVGKQDDTIRRISGRIEFDVPEDARDTLGGIEGGKLEFSVEFADVNGDQVIEAPSDARPISRLNSSLGSGGVLGGVGATGSESSSATAPGASGSAGSGASGSNGVTAPSETGADGSAEAPASALDAEDYRRYADCLDDARPEDTEALQRCAALLEDGNQP